MMAKEKFTVITYDGDGEMALVDEKNESIMIGDYYHDKIEDTIYGFFMGLKYAGVEYERIDEEREGSVYDSEYN
ncbi:hypothetical protein KYJ26_16850 [Bacillus sp. MCCB 382]|uniref:hypothetical protein n=1 Tax=Bacillus sp. MCCB 382 TaxID=2860197 RepID=UPI001C58909F|nr:hypothetical protein [Bacillus sp. MCCB 382]